MRFLTHFQFPITISTLCRIVQVFLFLRCTNATYLIPARFPPHIGPGVDQFAVEPQLLEGDAEEAVGLVAPTAAAQGHHLVVEARAGKKYS